MIDDDGMTPGLYFMRHGQTTANLEGIRSGGESDPPLTDAGREQARAAEQALHRRGATPGLIVSSPLARTLDTARILNARMHLEMHVDRGFIERRLGAWNGQSVEATAAGLAARETPPGGESDATFRARVLAAFRGLAPFYARWPLIVSSSGVARILMEHAGFEGVTGLPNGAVLCVTLATPETFEIARLERIEALDELQLADA